MGREKRSDVGAGRNRDEDDHGNIEEVGPPKQPILELPWHRFGSLEGLSPSPNKSGE